MMRFLLMLNLALLTQAELDFSEKSLCKFHSSSTKVEKILNLSRMAGRFIDQRHKGQGRIVLIRIVNEEVTLMQL